MEHQLEKDMLIVRKAMIESNRRRALELRAAAEKRKSARAPLHDTYSNERKTLEAPGGSDLRASQPTKPLGSASSAPPPLSEPIGNGGADLVRPAAPPATTPTLPEAKAEDGGVAKRKRVEGVIQSEEMRLMVRKKAEAPLISSATCICHDPDGSYLTRTAVCRMPWRSD